MAIYGLIIAIVLSGQIEPFTQSLGMMLVGCWVCGLVAGLVGELVGGGWIGWVGFG